jgi:hypothetical protein
LKLIANAKKVIEVFETFFLIGLVIGKTDPYSNAVQAYDISRPAKFPADQSFVGKMQDAAAVARHVVAAFHFAEGLHILKSPAFVPPGIPQLCKINDSALLNLFGKINGSSLLNCCMGLLQPLRRKLWKSPPGPRTQHRAF